MLTEPLDQSEFCAASALAPIDIGDQPRQEVSELEQLNLVRTDKLNSLDNGAREIVLRVGEHFV
jgi:hypothetical protein